MGEPDVLSEIMFPSVFREGVAAFGAKTNCPYNDNSPGDIWAGDKAYCWRQGWWHGLDQSTEWVESDKPA